jgi:Amino acid transporters
MCLFRECMGRVQMKRCNISITKRNYGHPKTQPNPWIKACYSFCYCQCDRLGVYKKVAPMADTLHSSGWVLVAWVIAGIVSLFGALSYAEVAGCLRYGGDYAYYKKIYNRFFAFQFGWSRLVMQTAAISSLAYVFAESLNSIVHLPPMLESLSGIIWRSILPF